MSESNQDAPGLSDGAIAALVVVIIIVVIVWGVCFMYVLKFMKFRAENQGGHSRSSDRHKHRASKSGAGVNSVQSIASSNSYTANGPAGYGGGAPTAYIQSSATTFGANATSYGATSYGATTMLQGATTIVSGAELSIPGFLLMQTDTDFKLGKVIARGGAGVIYAALSISPSLSERTRGVEIVSKGFGDSLLKMEEDYRNAFYQELSLMWRFSNEEGFVKVFGYTETPAMIIMKFYKLGTMADFIHDAGKISQEYYYTKRGIVRLFSSLCKSLVIMHYAGYVHSDIKPGNVLLDQENNGGLKTVLSDFGICQIVDPTVLRVKAFRVSQAIGASLSYAAPEILEFLRSGQALKADETLKKGDVYALACVLHECLTRKVPWR